MITWLERCIITLILSFFLSGSQNMYAQNRSFLVDSLTTQINGEIAPYDQVKPGDTLLIEHGQRDFLLIRNLSGDADNPVIILNYGGVVKINTDHYYGFSFRNCRYFRFSGTGDADHFYGFMVERVETGGGIGIGDKSSDFEIDHVSIEHCNGAGINAKTDPDCSFTTTRGNFTQFHSVIHDNYIAGVSNEGVYLGSTKYFGQLISCGGKDTLLLPSLLDGVRIYSNIIRYTGWDGIQVSSASSDCQVFDNLILYDSQDEFYNQMSGILIGGGSKCDCFNNYIGEGKGNGIENHGLGGYRVFNNIIVDAGRNFQTLDSSQMRHGIFISDVTAQQDSSFIIINNDIINPKSDGIRFASIHSRNNLVASNLIINPGNFDYYENGNTSFEGADSYIMITDPAVDVNIKNNYLARTAENGGFSINDYTLMPGSPLIDAAYKDYKDILFDYYHHPRPYGSGSDIGAFEFNPEYLGIKDGLPGILSKLKLFPNPAITVLTIQYQVDRNTDVFLDVYDLKGTGIIHERQASRNAGIHEFRIDVENFEAGIFLFTLRAAGISSSGRFIKIR